ncbi:MAG: acyl-homoserine-lactone synthase [Holosporales bacterium]
MILVIHHSQIDYFEHLMSAYFSKRYEVFFERLKWKVQCSNGMEKDQYDSLNSTYLIQVNPKHGVSGGVRFLPTTEPYMLKNTFGFLAKDKFKAPEDKNIIESSRFFSLREPSSDVQSLVSQTTYELVLGMLEYSLINSIKQIITVTDPKIVRIFTRMGWPLDILSESTDMQTGEKIVCGTWKVTKQYADALREKSGIRGPVIWYPLGSDEKDTKEVLYHPSFRVDPLGVAALRRRGI